MPSHVPGALPDGHRPTDIGNADRLAAIADGRIRHVHAWQKWLAYRDGVWRIDPGDALIIETAKPFPDACSPAGKLGRDGEDLWKQAKRLEASASPRRHDPAGPRHPRRTRRPSPPSPPGPTPGPDPRRQSGPARRVQEPLVPKGEVMEARVAVHELGVPAHVVEAAGYVLSVDWRGELSLSMDDAARFRGEQHAATAEHEKAWAGRGSASTFPIHWRVRSTPPPVELDVERRLWVLEQIGLDADEGIATRGGRDSRRRYLDLMLDPWGP